MKGWFRKLLPLVVVAVVVAGALAILAARWLDQTLSAEGVAARLGAAIGRDVRIGSLEVHLTPWVGVRLEGLTVGSDAVIDVAEISPRLLALLRGRAEPAHIAVEGARIAIVRTADGRMGLGEAIDGRIEPGEADDAPNVSEVFGAMPEIRLEDTTIELVDHAVGPEPVRTYVHLATAQLDPSILTASAELRGLVKLGREGDRGELSVTGQVAPYGSSFDVSIEVRALDLALSSPYLQPSLDDTQLEGHLEGLLRVRRSAHGEIEAEASLVVPDAELALAGAELLGPTRAAAKLSWHGDSWTVRDTRLESAKLQPPGSAPALEEISLAVASLVVHHVDEADGPFPGAEASGFSLQLRGPKGPLSLHGDRLVLDAITPGAPARLALDLKLGEGSSPGLLVVQAESAPVAEGSWLPPGPFRVEMSLESLDPEFLLPYLPAEWEGGSRDAELAGAATLTVGSGGGAGEVLSGEARLDLRRGVLLLAGAEIRDSSVAGVVGLGEQGLRLDEGRFESGQVSIGPHVGSGVRARVAWSGKLLEVAAIDLDSYEGPLVLVGAEDVDLPVFHLTRAEGISGFGPTGEWPLGGRSWLRMPSQVSIVDADGTIDDPRSTEAPATVVRIEHAQLRDFVAGGTASLALRARLGTPDRPQGRIEAAGSWGPLGAEAAALSGTATVGGLDAQLMLAYAPASWDVAGEPGPLDASLSVQAKPGARLVVDGNVRTATGTLTVRELELDAPISWRGEIVAERGEVEIEDGLLEARRVRVAELEAEDLRAAHAWKRNALALPSVAWRAYGGSWQQVGGVTLDDPLRFDLNLTVEGADVGRLIGAEATEVPTVLRGHAAVQGPWNGGDRWLEGVEGEGALDLSGGTLPASELLRVVWNALRIRVPGLGAGAGSEQRSARTRLRSASVPFRVTRNRVRADALELLTDDYAFRGEGRLSQSFDARLNGELQFTAEGISKLLRVGGIPQAMRRGFRLPAIPIEARGPVGGMSFRADVRRVPSATLSGLLGLPGRALDAARGVGDSVRGMGRRAVGGTGAPDEPEAR